MWRRAPVIYASVSIEYIRISPSVLGYSGSIANSVTKDEYYN